jgi:two-component system, cell cycle sensor histidine kinase and response regulator CckA
MGQNLVEVLPGASPSRDTGSAVYTVLSVDDNEMVRYVRRHILESARFRVVEAADGEAALRLASVEDVSLVLLDIRLPDVDGFAVCERLKARPRTASVPIVHISALGRMEADLPESLRHHADAYLREPVEPETLVSVVQSLIDARTAQRQTAAAEERYRALVDSALAAIWVCDGSGTIRFVNNRFAETLQYSAEELQGRHAWDLAPEDYREMLHATITGRIEADATDRYDVPLRRRDGSIVWLSGTGKLIRGDHGVITGSSAVFIDITERKLAQHALVESQQRSELALDVAELGAWEVDMTTGLVTASGRTCSMFDFEAAQPHVEDWIARIHPEDRGRVREELDAAMAGRAIYDTQYRIVNRDGPPRWIHAKARPVVDTSGRAIRLVGVAQEITTWKQAEAERERQRRIFETIIENIPVMLCLFDPQLQSFHLNRECERVLGWTTEDANRGNFIQDVYPDPDYRQAVVDYMQALTPGWRELTCATKNGEVIPCEWANIRLVDDRSIGIGIDLRPRKEAEEALRRSEASLEARAAELQAIMDALPVAIFVARDPACREVIGSRATYKLLRLPYGSNLSAAAAGGIAGCRFVRNDPELPPCELPHERAAANGQPVHDYEFDVLFDDGTRRNLLANAVPLLDDESQAWGAVSAAVDITDRKRAEERLREAQKLESVGLLAGGIAHDFNNLLTAIMGNTSIVLNEVGPAPARRLKGILRSAQRAARLIRQLLAYSGKGEVISREIDVTQAIAEMRGLMELSVPKSVRLRLDLEQRIPRVRMDPSQLEQIIMNLVINAGEAIGEGNPGHICISTSVTVIDHEFVDALGGHVNAGRYLQIEVTDSGSGITVETLRKVFDPFFSTKFAGRGLGLAAVAGIVRSTQGAIAVESAPGAGSMFRVLLPVSDSGQWEAEPTNPGAAVVLVVDDDESVREFIADVARGLGYQVFTACDGEDAIAVCGRRKHVDAAVLDIVMPGIGTNVLLPKLKELCPDVRILLTSGYSELAARRLCAAYPDAAFVEKPYTAQQIGDAIEALFMVG